MAEIDPIYQNQGAIEVDIQRQMYRGIYKEVDKQRQINRGR